MTAVWILRRTVLDLRRQRWSLLGLAATFALAASLAAGYRLGSTALQLDHASASPRSGPPAQVIVYLRDDLDRPAAHKLRDVLIRLPGVQQVALVSGDEALVKLRRQLGERGRMLDGADDGLLPASLEVWLSPGGDPITRAHQLAWRLQRLDGIVDADVIDARTDVSSEGRAQASQDGRTVLLATAALGGAAILGGGIIWGRRRRRDELRVLLAMGFTRGALLAPVVLLAMAAAMVGSAAGLTVAGLARRLASDRLVAGSSLTVNEWGLGLLAAVILGAVAGVARGWAPDAVDAR